MNLPALQTAVRSELSRFGLEPKGDHIINYFLNQGGSIFAREARCIRKSQAISVTAANVTAGLMNFPLQAGALEVLQARWETRVLALTSPEELGAFYQDWIGLGAAVPHAYYMFDSQTVRLFRKPAATGTLDVDLVMGWVTDLAAATDDPETVNGLPARYHLALVYYAAMQMALPQVGSPDPAKKEAAGVGAAVADIKSRYEALLAEARDDTARGFSHEFRRVPFRAY